MIEIISASAGSGKTYRLASLLRDAVAGGSARPDAIIATTFTRKAAAELQERTRLSLLGAGAPEAAQRLKASRIGTVNSVCGQIVEDFAYELGLPPRLRVIEEQAAGELLRTALEDARDQGDLRDLSEILARFDPDFDIDGQIKAILDQARANQVGPDELVAAATTSAESYLALLDPVPAGMTAAGMDDSLRTAIEAALHACPRELVSNKGFYPIYDLCGQVSRAIASGRPVRWGDWLKISKAGGAGKNSKGAFDALPAVAGNVIRHPLFRSDLAGVIRIAFATAARALALFQERKRDLGVIDFVDQETHALRLLDTPSVAARLANEVDLFLVDEFQDTSPLQLAIFMRLAQIARRSVWVGDQKQSIYAFRGTDPALMDAAMEAILKDVPPETLGFSWRSRKKLVDLTSALFAPAFTTQGIPENRTRLQSKVSEPPSAALGTPLEAWAFLGEGGSMNKGLDARCLAAGVAELLEDATVQVRCPTPGEVRRVVPGDIAVLCRTNDEVSQIAGELAAIGIDVVLGRAGLLTTLEGIVLRAVLALWVDPGDALAAAQVARILHSDPDGDEWFRDVLSGEDPSPLFSRPTVQKVAEARDRQPLAGPVAAFDALCEALDLPRLVRRWADAPQRMANLEAFRRHLVAYAASAAQEGHAATPAGALLHLDTLARDGEDAQGTGGDGNALTLSTWHRAKGLEWPVTILTGLHKGVRSSPFGVHMEAAGEGFDVARPLAGRRVRFWPNPFNAATTKSVFHDRVSNSDEAREAQRQAERQELRLLYVGWTRARDRLVLAGRPPGARDSFWDKGMLPLLARDAGFMLPAPDAAAVTWAGVSTPVTRRELSPRDRQDTAPAPGLALQPTGPVTHPPAHRQPSAEAETGVVAGEEVLHQRLRLTGKPDMAALGEALHRFFASDRSQSQPAAREAMAERLLRGYGVPGALPPDELVRAADGLWGWIGKRFPGSTLHHEVPLHHPLADGSAMVGRADLVVETEAGLVLIDHKAFPGPRDDGLKHAASFGGQLSAYAAAIAAAAGRPVLACWIHLPVLGMMVEIAVR